MSRAVAEADRRIGNVLQIGTIVSVDAGSARARVKVGSIDIPNAHVAQLAAGPLALWWMPQAGDQVLVAAPGGDLAQAVVTHGLYAGNAPSSDPGVPLFELNGGVIRFNGTLEVTGDVIASGISLGATVPSRAMRNGPSCRCAARPTWSTTASRPPMAGRWTGRSASSCFSTSGTPYRPISTTWSPCARSWAGRSGSTRS